MDKLSDDIKLGFVRKYLAEKWEEGVECPCCHQWVRLYKRKLTSSMVKALKLMYDAPRGWMHVERYLKEQPIGPSVRGDFPKLRYWGLIEPKPADNPKFPDAVEPGYYRITDKGIAFVNGAVRVFERVKIYNDKFYGFEGKEIDYNTAKGNQFDIKDVKKRA